MTTNFFIVLVLFGAGLFKTSAPHLQAHLTIQRYRRKFLLCFAFGGCFSDFFAGRGR